MNIESLTDLLIAELQDIYDAEQQLVKGLPKLAEAAFSEELKENFLTHLEETRGQVERLERAFKLLGIPVKGKHCAGMAGLIEEAEELIEEGEEGDPSVLDAGLIVAAQKVEHYEIAAYGSARTFAETLGAKDVEKLLQQTLNEEELTDRKLTALAESTINLDAADSDEEILKESQSSGKGGRRKG
jgi:ferritin-like metal-binding protein YciE